MRALIGYVWLCGTLLAAENGLQWQKFFGTDFHGSAVCQVVSNLDFVIKEANSPQRFSASYSGYLLPPESGTYEIELECDDGASVWLDDDQIIHSWGPGYFEHRKTVNLIAKQRTYLQVLYANFEGSAQLKMSWKPPGQQKQVIPSSCFVPAAPKPRLLFFRPEPEANFEPIPVIITDLVAFDPQAVFKNVKLSVNGIDSWVFGARHVGPYSWHLQNLPKANYVLTVSALAGDQVVTQAEHRFSVKDHVAPAETIRKSDICIPWRWASHAEMREYGATVLGWGPALGQSDRMIPEFRRAGIRNIAFDLNLIIIAPSNTVHGQNFLNDSALRQSLMVDFDGQPVTMSWWQNCLWRCPLHSFSQAKLFYAIEEGMKSNPDSLHFDGALGTLCGLWNPESGMGCFCDEVVAGFTEYLRRNYSREELAAKGIENIDGFNYLRFLKQKFPTRKEFDPAFRKNEVPLAFEYQTYQYRALADLYRKLIWFARGRRGKNIPLAANLHSLRFNMLPPVDAVDYLYCEMRYSDADNCAVVPFKLAEALGKPFAALMDSHTIRQICETKTPDLIKRWAGLTFAMGGNMCIPSLQGLRLKENQLDEIRFRRDDYRRYFQLVKNHPELFEGYASVPQIGLLYSMAARWHDSYPQYQQLAKRLFDLNMPFSLIPAGDERMVCGMQTGHLACLDGLVIPSNPRLSPDHLKMLERSGVRTIEVSLDTSGKELRKKLNGLSPLITAPDTVWAVPRANPLDPKAPLVIHVINREFHKATNTHHLQNRIAITTHPRLLAGRTISAAQLLTPESDAQECALITSPNGMTVILPKLHVWGIVSLTLKGP